HVPVPRRHDAMHQGPVVEDRQVESRTIPADKSRGVMLHGLEKLLDQRGLGIARLSQGTDAQAIIVPEDTAYDGNLLQVQGQEIMPDSFPARSKGTFGNLIVRQFAPPAVEGMQALNIRYGFQVKDQ